MVKGPMHCGKDEMKHYRMPSTDTGTELAGQAEQVPSFGTAPFPCCSVAWNALSFFFQQTPTDP